MSLRRIFFCQNFWASRIVGDYCEDFSLCQRRPNKRANNSKVEGGWSISSTWGGADNKNSREKISYIFFSSCRYYWSFSRFDSRQPEIVTVDDKNNILLTNNIMKWESDKAFLSVRCHWQAELNNKKYFFSWKQPSLAGEEGKKRKICEKYFFLSFFFAFYACWYFSSFTFLGRRQCVWMRSHSKAGKIGISTQRRLIICVYTFLLCCHITSHPRKASTRIYDCVTEIWLPTSCSTPLLISYVIIGFSLQISSSAAMPKSLKTFNSFFHTTKHLALSLELMNRTFLSFLIQHTTTTAASRRSCRNIMNMKIND